MLQRGRQPGPARSLRYDLFGADYPDGADSGARIEESQLPTASRGLLRRIYSATVALRNREGGS
jgi:type IV pilus assembly protein PilW